MSTSQPPEAKPAPASARGHFKVFVHAVSGAGRTFAMVQAAAARAREGATVAVGFNTHAHPEIEALLSTFTHFDLEGAEVENILAHHPTLVLIDDLAQANSPGTRHSQRYLDALELLSQGVEVYATLDLAQLESMNPHADSLDGGRAQETIPDWVLDGAEIQIIDPAPGGTSTLSGAPGSDGQMQDMSTVAPARHALLRWKVEFVDPHTQVYRTVSAHAGHGLADERVMVCVSGGALMGRVIRTGRQMAYGLHAEWVAVYVETPEHYRLAEDERERVARALKLAEELGAETVILPGQDVAYELLRYARAHGITKLVVGKPRRRRWPGPPITLADELVRSSGTLNVFIVMTPRAPSAWTRWGNDARNLALGGYMLGLVAVAAATLSGLFLHPYLDPDNISLIYLLAVVLCATTWGLGPSILSSVLAVFLLDALFVPPYGLVSIGSVQDLLRLGVFLLVAVVISELGARVRDEVEATRLREQQAAALYALSRDLAWARTRAEIKLAAVKQINQVFNAEATIWLSDGEGTFRPEPPVELDDAELNAAKWAFEHDEAAGSGTPVLSHAVQTYLPLRTAQRAFGVLALRQSGKELALTADRRRLLETFAGQIAIALENASLSAQAEQARVLEESDRFRNALLSSISHDLRTPLASVLGAATSLLDEDTQLQAASRRDLVLTIQEEATRLNRLVGNLLNMTRLESGALVPRREWHSLEEVVGAALAHVESTTRIVQLDIAPDLPFVPFDFVLIEQVLLNLLDNAFKYSPPDSAVEIAIRRHQTQLSVCVSDCGIGIPAEERARVFEKFYRGRDTAAPGTGLGLAICKGIVEAHGGTIGVEAPDGGGTRIRFTLPTQM